jgi:hypothetical protein
VHFSSPGNPGNATGRAVEEPGYAQPKRAPFTKEDQRAVRRVLREFETTAVVGRSWAVSAPSLREGFTREQWNRGDLPVVPYPAADKGLESWDFVQYSYTDTLGLEVFLFPKPGSGRSAMTADVELVKGKDGQCRVDYWMPKKFHGPPAVAAKAKAKVKRIKHTVAKKAPAKRQAAAQRQAAPSPAATAPPKPSRAWWLVPIALLSLIVLSPLGFGLASWHRNRKARRDYLRGAS